MRYYTQLDIKSLEKRTLESYRTPLNWSKIKKVLMMHYSDKRDIGTLEYQMTTLFQKNMPLTDFYKKVYEHLSLLLDKVSCLDISEEAKGAMINSYREKALDTFVRGLNGDLPRLLSIREPTSLPQALNLCQRLDNMNFRTHYAQTHLRGNATPALQRSHNSLRPVFYPELAHLPPHFRSYPLRPHFQYAQRPFAPQQFGQQNQRPNFPSGFNNRTNFPAKPPQPMEVDQSMRTKNVNYQNFQRNEQFAPKRPHPMTGGIPPKIQRNYFTNTYNEAEPDTQYCNQYPYYDPYCPTNTSDQSEFADSDPNKLYENKNDETPNDEKEIDSVYFLD